MKSLFDKILMIVIYYLSGLIPKKENIIIFGSWIGNRYDDNSRFLFEYMMKSAEFKNKKLIWIGNKKPSKLSDNAKFIKRNSFKSILYILIAKYAFMTQGYEDFNKYNLLRNSIKVQLWHGVPIKIIGDSNLKIDTWIQKLRYCMCRYDYFIASSSENKNKLISCFNFMGASEDNVILSGQPRNDYLLNNYNTEYIQELKKRNNIPENKLIVTYLPTFRDNTDKVFTFSKCDDEFSNFLNSNNIIICEKPHFRSKVCESKNSSVISINKDMSTQDILLVTDILVTDYSSVYIDYLLLNKPIIHFVYDKEEYIKNDRGLFYEFDHIVGGEQVKNVTDLKKSIIKYIVNPNKDLHKRKELRKFLLSSELGKSCEILSNIIK